jgi:hypothetical protein
MGGKGLTAEERRELIGPLAGAVLLRRIFPLLGRLARCGTLRDTAGNRQLFYSQYAALLLVGFFNPILKSARALVAASGLRKVRQVTGGQKVSAGAFSEASSVFDPALLEGLVQELRRQFQQHQFRLSRSGRLGRLPDKLVQRLVAVDGSVLSALPQIAARLGRRGQGHSRPQGQGQWRLHTQLRIHDQTVLASTLTPEPAEGPHSERAVTLRQIQARNAKRAKHTLSTAPDGTPADPMEPGDLFILDRGYRSAALFNELVQAGCDYVCRLNCKDGRVVDGPVTSSKGIVVRLPELTPTERDAGIVADELITLGGNGGASPTGTNHVVRRITVELQPGRPSSARQGRVRSDQTGREGLVLATTLVDLPAEQVVLIYECRWQVELFFRFLKQVLGCKQLLAAKTRGVEIQLYCALRAGLLLALATGGNLTRRNYEMVCLYMTGWADNDELVAALAKPP